MIKLHYPKFYRQRLILILLEKAGGCLSKMDFQKLLFLLHQKTGFLYYDFIPYRYGSYSFQAASDIEALQATGWLKLKEKNITLLKQLPQARGLKGYETDEIGRFMQSYKDYRGRRLLRYTYQYYPYYAIKSKIAHNIVDKETYKRIQAERSRTIKQESVLYTIGYEGLTFEAYINKLIAKDIRLLCDVRKNPLSRKFGFSKGILSSVLPKLGVEYLHVPTLGIVSQKRKQLETKDDYIRLFAEYRESLPEKASCLQNLTALMECYQRIALTCFERHSYFCHRHCISDYLETEKDTVVVHL